MREAKTRLDRMWRRLLTLGPADRGDEGVTKVLIIALIVIPLVMLLMSFSNQVVDWLRESWQELKGQGGMNQT